MRVLASSVIKHRAPNGALKQTGLNFSLTCISCHKAPSAKRCIKTSLPWCCSAPYLRRHKAPSAKRCIKTRVSISEIWSSPRVIKHRAPNGALKRCCSRSGSGNRRPRVIKHRAPNGALKPLTRRSEGYAVTVIKHRAPNGALKPLVTMSLKPLMVKS